MIPRHTTPEALQNPIISAVFATMNRSTTAVSCVIALARQTRPPNWVIVADNASQDGTSEALKFLTDLPFLLTIIDMPENLGNAGGVSEAMEQSFANGADAVWILDDDSWPQPGSLAALLERPLDPNVVRHPVQIDPKTKRFTWPLQVTDGQGGWRLAGDLNELPPGDFVPSRITWTGALVPRHVRESVGPVNAALFIRGEDEEYPWRIEQAGFRQEAVRNAILDHPGPDKIVHWQFCGKHFFYEPGLADWKLYYKIRNMVWLKRRQSGGLHSARMAVTYAIAAITLDGLRRVPLLRRAIIDGWRGKLGKMPD